MPATSEYVDRHVTPRETFHLPFSLREALLRYIDDTEPRPEKSEVLRLALRKFLAEKGYWPPPEGES